MALNMQIFHHPRNQTTGENKQQQQQYIETTRLHFRRRPQPIKRTQSKLLQFRTNLSIPKNNKTVSSPATSDTGKR